MAKLPIMVRTEIFPGDHRESDLEAEKQRYYSIFSVYHSGDIGKATEICL